MLMSSTQLGLVAGLALGIAGAFGGFGVFLIVAIVGAAGLLVGRYLDGHLDLAQLGERAGTLGRDRGRGL